MKTSYSWCVVFLVLGGVAMVAAQNMLFVKASAQGLPSPAGPAVNVRGDGSVVEHHPDGTIIERQKDGKVLRSTTRVPTFRVEQLADGTFVQVPEFTDTPDGGRVLLGGAPAADPETARLLQEELQVTQAAQKLWSEFRNVDAGADVDGDKETIKSQLREKLLSIFELQQKRRAHEVAQIEKRLARLKETMSKRDSAKDAIVDRRLNVLTGGIDELGWEDTFRQLGAGSQTAAPQYGAPAIRGGINLPGPTLLPHPDTTDALLPQTPVPATPAPPTRSIPPSTSPVPENPARPAAEPAALPSSSR